MNFKRLLLFLAAPLALVMSGCEEDLPTYSTPTITITDASGAEVTALNFGAEVGSQTIRVTANYSWTSSENAEWLTVTPSSDTNISMQDKTTEVQIKVMPNDDNGSRTETIKFVMDKTEKNITVTQAGKGQVALGEVLYYDNFDKDGKQAQSGTNGWKTYIDSEGAEFLNPTPESQANVTYGGKSVSVRSNTANGSGGKHSNYEGSGLNYIWFGTKPTYLTVSGISLSELEGNALTLSFGTERYEYEVEDNTFNNNEFHVYISGDGEKWSEVSYTFLNGANLNGKWNIATAQFNLKEVPETLSLYFTATVASAYAIDDIKLNAGGGGVEIDLAAGGAIDGAGSGDNDDIVTEPDPNAQTITVAQFIENADTNTTYQLTGTIVGPVNTTFGNFDLVDESGKIYVYGLIDGSTGKNLDWAAKGLSEGDIITVQGKYYFYEKGSKHEIENALYISHTANSTPRITSVSPEEMSFSAEGGSKVATVNTAGNGGTLAATTAAEWLTVSAADGVVTIVAAANEGEAREAEVTVTYGESTATVTVKQAAPIVAGSVVTATITFDDKAKRSVYTNDQQVWEENGITVTNDKAASTTNIGDYTNPARFYKSSNVTVSVAGTISKLVFHINSYDNGKYITAMTDSVEGETVDGNAVTIVLDGTSSSYSFTTANQVWVDSIDVTYTAGEQGGDNGETPENPEGGEPTDPENPEGGEPTDPENPEGGEPTDPENPEGGETPEEPETLATLDTEAYYVFKQATEFVPGKWYAIVAENKAATALTGNYGYLQVVTPIALTDGISLPASCAWGVVSTEGGYTIQQYDGKYVYQSGSYDSFNVAATAPTSGQVWTIENGVITNATTAKTVQYDTNYNSYGCYATVKGVYPTFYELIEVDNAAYLLGTSVSSLSYTADGGENTFAVTTYGEATLAATTAAEWLTVSAADGVVTVVAAANEGETRTAEVTVTFGEDTATVLVSQSAPAVGGEATWHTESWSNASSHANVYQNGTINGDLGTWAYDGCSTYDEAQFTSKVGLALGKTADVKEAGHTAPIIVSPTFDGGIQGIKFNYYANNTARKVIVNVYENGTLVYTQTVQCATKNALVAAEIEVTTSGATYFEFVSGNGGDRRFSVGDIEVKF